MNRVVVIKAVNDEWVLDVLGVPFGGPNAGRDSDGEFFSPNTKLHEDKYPMPPIVYYHGYTDGQSPADSPEYIGRAVERTERPDGVWYRVVLDKANEIAKRVWEAAQRGVAAASSGTIEHLHRVAKDGFIEEWPVAELSVFETDTGKQPANTYAVALPALKAVYDAAGLTWSEYDIPEPEAGTTSEGHRPTGTPSHGDAEQPDPEQDTTEQIGAFEMDEQEVSTLVADAVKAALDAERTAQAEADEAKAKEKEVVDAAVKAALEARDKEDAATKRLPGGDDDEDMSGRSVAKYSNLWKYDNLSEEDLSFMHDVLGSAKSRGMSRGVSEDATKALAIRLAESKDPNHTESKQAMKAAKMPFKANELNQSTLADYGDEWAGVTYSSQLWRRITQDSPIISRVPAVTIPQGSESIVLPLNVAPPTFYLVAQASAQAANPGDVTRTFTSSRLQTSNKTLSTAKLGALTIYTGELEEDSVVPWVTELRMDMQQEAMEVLEHVIIDGDTETGATTNINDIGGTPAGSEAYLAFDGFRKSCLITTTANARDGGALAAADYLETLKLMGLGGRNVLDRATTAFIQDVWTGWKALELTEVKTMDVFSAPTIENGQLISIWGRDVITTANMHRFNTDTTYGLKANSAGKVDLDTAANNTTGAILAVRFDQWRLGYKRRTTVETERVIDADATKIVMHMRVGLVQRDTEASAISYNLTL